MSIRAEIEALVRARPEMRTQTIMKEIGCSRGMASTCSNRVRLEPGVPSLEEAQIAVAEQMYLSDPDMTGARVAERLDISTRLGEQIASKARTNLGITESKRDRIRREAAERRAAVIEIALTFDEAATVRQIFYRCAVRGVVEKHETKGYAKVVRILGDARLDGTIPWDKIEDRSRQFYWPPDETEPVPDDWSDLEEIIERNRPSPLRPPEAPLRPQSRAEWEAQRRERLRRFERETRAYRDALESYPQLAAAHDQRMVSQLAMDVANEVAGFGQPIPVWCFDDVPRPCIVLEKEALSVMIGEAANSFPFAVPAVVYKGFSSLTQLKDLTLAIAAEQESDAGANRHVILTMTDRDSYGDDLDMSARRNIHAIGEQHGYELDLEFRRIALTKEQVERFDLPSRPEKRKSRGEIAWELDALEPADLKQIVRDAIAACVPDDIEARVHRARELVYEDVHEAIVDTFIDDDGIVDTDSLYNGSDE